MNVALLQLKAGYSSEMLLKSRWPMVTESGDLSEQSLFDIFRRFVPAAPRTWGENLTTVVETN